MKRELKWALGALAVLVASVAMAGVAKGGKLYIKGSGVNAWDKADASGKKSPLKAGDEVTWQGADEKNKQMQAIEYGPGGKKKGFVQMANLATTKPIDEYPTGDGKGTSAAAFASSGAATKALGGAGLKMADGSGPKGIEAAAGIIHLEGSSEDQKKKVAEHVKKAGLGAEK